MWIVSIQHFLNQGLKLSRPILKIISIVKQSNKAYLKISNSSKIKRAKLSLSTSVQAPNQAEAEAQHSTHPIMTNKRFFNRQLINFVIKKSFSSKLNKNVSKTKRKWLLSCLKKKWYYRLAIKAIISKLAKDSSIPWWKKRPMSKWPKVSLSREIISSGNLNKILKIKIRLLKISIKLNSRQE